ncbi:hypothetical protein [Microbacterium sp. NPDC090003]|uniref:hypothetical protein n=1 Tax=Microbacterium sp. NPDC090003 TaxID=3364203 RepID=UPI0038118F67
MARRFTRVTRATLGSVLSVAVLVGCTAPQSNAIESPAATEVAVDSTPEPTTPPVPVPTPESIPAECIPSGGDGMIATGEPLNVELYSNVHDYGPREGASGTVEYASDGTPASYEVASGDHVDAILKRLCIGFYSLQALNAVRRGSVHSVDPTNQAYLAGLYVGDALNLSPYTITSVGDLHGEVYAYKTSFVLPPQR